MSLIDRIYRHFATDVGRTLEDSLLDAPQEWRPDSGRYRIENESRAIRIWIANAAYGLRVEYGNGFAASEFSPSYADRHLIWRAVQTMNIPTPERWKAICASRHIAGNA